MAIPKKTTTAAVKPATKKKATAKSTTKKTVKKTAKSTKKKTTAKSTTKKKTTAKSTTKKKTTTKKKATVKSTTKKKATKAKSTEKKSTEKTAKVKAAIKAGPRVVATPSIVDTDFLKGEAKPSTDDQIDEAILNLKTRGGSSKIAIFKWLKENYGEGLTDSTIKTRIRNRIARGIESGHYIQKKQSFSLSPTAKRRNLSGGGMVLVKKTGRLAAAKRIAPSRPVKQWCIDYACTHQGKLSADKLIADLIKKNKIPSAQQSRFSITTSAMITRCINTNLFDGDSDSFKITAAGKKLQTGAKSDKESKKATETGSKKASTTSSKKAVGRPKKAAAAAVEEEVESEVEMEAESGSESGTESE